jgi:hypothetical protein
MRQRPVRVPSAQERQARPEFLKRLEMYHNGYPPPE